MHGTHMACRVEITARPITRTVTVASPLNPGLTDKVEFVASPLDRVRGKQRLLPEQVMAGEKYQNAWTMLQGPRAMQWESNVQSARGPRISPAIPLMQAGEVLASATSIIGKNVLIIEAVLGYGYIDGGGNGQQIIRADRHCGRCEIYRSRTRESRRRLLLYCLRQDKIQARSASSIGLSTT